MDASDLSLASVSIVCVLCLLLGLVQVHQAYISRSFKSKLVYRIVLAVGCAICLVNCALAFVIQENLNSVVLIILYYIFDYCSFLSIYFVFWYCGTSNLIAYFRLRNNNTNSKTLKWCRVAWTVVMIFLTILYPSCVILDIINNGINDESSSLWIFYFIFGFTIVISEGFFAACAVTLRTPLMIAMRVDASHTDLTLSGQSRNNNGHTPDGAVTTTTTTKGNNNNNNNDIAIPPPLFHLTSDNSTVHSGNGSVTPNVTIGASVSHTNSSRRHSSSNTNNLRRNKREKRKFDLIGIALACAIVIAIGDSILVSNNVNYSFSFYNDLSFLLHFGLFLTMISQCIVYLWHFPNAPHKKGKTKGEMAGSTPKNGLKEVLNSKNKRGSHNASPMIKSPSMSKGHQNRTNAFAKNGDMIENQTSDEECDSNVKNNDTNDKKDKNDKNDKTDKNKDNVTGKEVNLDDNNATGGGISWGLNITSAAVDAEDIMIDDLNGLSRKNSDLLEDGSIIYGKDGMPSDNTFLRSKMSSEMSMTQTQMTQMSQFNPSIAEIELDDNDRVWKLVNSSFEVDNNASPSSKHGNYSFNKNNKIGSNGGSPSSRQGGQGNMRLNVESIRADGRLKANRYGRPEVPRVNMNKQEKLQATNDFMENPDLFNAAPKLITMDRQITDDMDGDNMDQLPPSNTELIFTSSFNQADNVLDEPVSLVIYEVDYVLATLPDRIEEFSKSYDNIKSNKKLDKLLNSMGKEKFMLMFGGIERCNHLCDHLKNVLTRSGDKDFNTKCFVFSQRPTKFTITLLQQIELNNFFKSKAFLAGKSTDLSHIIGRDHALMKGNSNKEHLIILKLIYHFKKEHSNVLYVGYNKTVIDYLNSIGVCHTYHVKTKGMLQKDMQNIERQFLCIKEEGR